ncbi:hypothetical protein ACTFIZ_011863 [Dictyostelium cf. discoideum]
MNKKSLKIITLGDSGVGKTSIFNNFVTGKFEIHECSVPPSYYSKTLTVENECVTVNLWDTCDQESFYTLPAIYYRWSNCYTLCFDIHNEESFNNLEKWMDQVKKFNLINTPFILIGTKNDIPRTNKSISNERIEKWCKNIEDQGIIDKVYYFETSAKFSENITELYNVAAKLALEHYNKNKNTPITSPVIGHLEEDKPGYCC